MTADQMTSPGTLHLISGGRNKRQRKAAAANRPETTLPITPPVIPDAPALATELARLYALALLRDVPLHRMSDPDTAVRIDGATRITLHALTAEIAQLPWPHPQFRQATVASADNLSSLSVPGHADHPPVSRGDGQRLLPELLGLPRPSVFLEAGVLGATAPAPDIAPALPPDNAPMPHWLAWAETAIGACLPQPGPDRRAAPVRTLSDLAAQAHLGDPRQQPLSLALMLLGQGQPFDESLAAASHRWTGPRLMALMVTAARRATRALHRQDRRAARDARPAVVAATLALMHESEAMRGGPDTRRLTEALALLRRDTPNLLTWIGRLNAATGTGGFALPNRDGTETAGWTPLQFRENLMLPPLHHDGAALRPADAADRGVILGALVTLLKAFFAGGDDSRQTDEFDALAQNLVVGRSVAGGFYGYENAQHLRLGEAVALELLRETLEQDGTAAGLTLRGFDGRTLALRAEARGPGPVTVRLLKDGVPQLWPASGIATPPELVAAI
ncbi:hypothetical protein ACOXXX_03375 [Thalassococcus sp. BH17M4-6]|uniref:hypothetical protein n=1 Tax=Thalassococcus sp. BH17M4-6 TaxID=3413148 RepID=UPI003BD655C4